MHEPPTEPLPPARPLAAVPPPSAAPPSDSASAVPEASSPNASAPQVSLAAFVHTEYHFETGLRSGEIAHVRAPEGQTLLTYRSFAGVIGIVAALVSGIVAIAGLASVVFLIAEGAWLRAVVALVLTIVFTLFIALLAPRMNVTLYDGQQPAITISQRASSPATYVIAAPNGAHLAEVRKSPFSRLGRHRWQILHDGRYLGEAVEASFFGALLRKVLGKFSRAFETDLSILHGGVEAGRILRRPDARGRMDVLEITNDALDRRVLVAVATLVLGREP